MSDGYAAAKAAVRRERGLCPDCGAETESRSRCPAHLAAHAERERAKYRAAREWTEYRGLRGARAPK